MNHDEAIAQVLAEDRKKFIGQLSNPAILREVHATARLETSDMTALTESLLNRTSAMIYKKGKNVSLDTAIHNGFYGPVNRGEEAVKQNHLSRSEWTDFNASLAKTLAGANKVNLATDQGFKNEIHGDKWNVSGEWYGNLNRDKTWRNMIERKAAALMKNPRQERPTKDEQLDAKIPPDINLAGTAAPVKTAALPDKDEPKSKPTTPSAHNTPNRTAPLHGRRRYNTALRTMQASTETPTLSSPYAANRTANGDRIFRSDPPGFNRLSQASI